MLCALVNHAFRYNLGSKLTCTPIPVTLCAFGSARAASASSVNAAENDADVVVIGAGVVGLAVAKAIAQSGRDTLVIEQHEGPGMETSSRNSEGSLKARLCVEGRDRLYEYASSRAIRHARLGKLIAAQSESQRPALAALRKRAAANGVDLRMLTQSECRELEPEVTAAAGLLSPNTGIIDSHGLMEAFQADVEAAGSAVVFNTTFQGAEALKGGGFAVSAADAVTAETSSLRARALVNCAGLYTHVTAGRIRGLPPRSIPRVRFAKGNYFALTQRAPFRRLVYPMPEDGGLGAHLTLDLDGRARFGPDVEWLPSDDPRAVSYGVDKRRLEAVLRSVRGYWPGVPAGALVADYSGVRPKLSGPGQPAADFVVQGQAEHGVPGLVNMFGIESPGLTACIPLGELVRDMLLRGA